MGIDAHIWPDVATHPGEILAEELAARNMTQVDLARQMGRPVQAINEIIHGKKEITPETALQLQEALGIPAHVWTRLEADYRLTKARLAAPRSLAVARTKKAAYTVKYAKKKAPRGVANKKR